MISNSTNTEFPGFLKYPKIPYINEFPELYGRNVYVFEKIDGSLSQIRRTDKGILGGTKANYITGTMTRPSWSGKFLKWMHSNHSLYNLKPGTILFGEWLEPVTLDYHKETHDKFYFIDLAIINNGKINFYDYFEALDYLSAWKVEGVEIMPILTKRCVDENIAMEIIKNNPSYLRTLKVDKDTGRLLDCEMEGIVLKNYELERFAKVLHPKYSEIREEAKTIEGKYVNQARIDKAIREIQDSSGGNIKLNLDNLVLEVRRDIFDEANREVSLDSIKSIIRSKSFFRDNR